MRSDHRDEYPEIRKDKDVGFLDTDKVYWMKRDKVEKLSASGSKISCVSLKKPERISGVRESRKCK